MSEPGRADERRHFPRFWVQFPVSLITDGVKVRNGTVDDLSAGGCAVNSQRTVRRGEFVALQLSLPDDRAPIRPLTLDVAAVRWASRREFGLEFISMPS